ncbi:MAG: 2-oxo-4-hydroxy-4-carboxy-5-ureidoimidazoline decarboxylase [Sandaracinaceae bacterium]|nr:2-oxo-4-hydroxy-4-carboxy-5-ureidoimidazoline decarboxylase [Sandaracinaceae bacterium]
MITAARALDAMDLETARAALTRCCGARRWVDGMLARRPFGADEALMEAADQVWSTMEREDVLEAFTHHPRIGASVEELRKRFASTSAWSAGEQGAVAAAGEETLRALSAGNAAYEARYGFIFIVCATGKSAEEMLALLNARMGHEPGDELRVAAAEQAKITKLRLAKLSEGT